MQLPESLNSWKRWLDWFPDKLRPALSELLLQLNPLIGPMKASLSSDEKAPEGLGDLRNRGSYQNLLSSEWLLAEEEPDEFIRRAINHEHLFLAPERQRQKAGALIVALFDSGVLQLGAPRLVHIAMLILLAKRAEQTGNLLKWGIVQDPVQLTIFNGIDDILTLLKKRTYQPATSQQLNDWEKWLIENHTGESERWLIGAPTTKNLSTKRQISHFVCVERAIVDPDKLKVELLNRVNHKTVLLTLPNPIIAAELLSGKFNELKQPRIVKRLEDYFELNSAPVISSSGNYILTVMKGGYISLFKLSDITKPKQYCKISRWRNEGDAVAFDFRGREASAIICLKQKLCLWRLGKKIFDLRADNFDYSSQHTPPYLPLIAIFRSNDLQFCLLNKDNALISWQIESGYLAANKQYYENTIVDTNVRALVRAYLDHFVYVKYDDGQFTLRHYPNTARSGYHLGAGPENATVLLSGGKIWFRGFSACAISQNGKSWVLYTGQSNDDNTEFYKKERINFPEEWRAIGLYDDFEEEIASFVVCDTNDTKVALYSNGLLDELYASRVKLVQVSYCPISHNLALLTINNELIVFHIPTRTIRLKVEGW